MCIVLDKDGRPVEAGQVADELITLRTQNQQLRAALVRAREEFEHFTEYWNGDINYQAMNNALNHIEFGARKQSEKIDAILSGQTQEDKGESK